MKLPEITQEILDSFDEDGCHLIEWEGQECTYNRKPQWTKTAIDFARLVVQGEAKKFYDWHKVADERRAEIVRLSEKIAGLEVELKAAQIKCGSLQAELDDTCGMLAKDVCGECNFLERGDCHVQKEELRAEIERMRDFEDSIEHSVAMWLSVEDCQDETLTTADRVLNAVEEMHTEIKRMRPVVGAAKAYEVARNALSFHTKDGSNDYLFDNYNAAHVALIREVMNYEAKKP